MIPPGAGEAIPNVCQIIGPLATKGSGFFVAQGNDHFLVTARHVIFHQSDDSQQAEIVVRWNSIPKLQEIRLNVHLCSPREALGDIAVFVIPAGLGQSETVLNCVRPAEPVFPVTSTVVSFGYPGELQTDHRTTANLALARHGMLSGFLHSGIQPSPYDYVLDMHSSPGSSGGPVLWHNGAAWFVVGVVCSEMTIPLEPATRNDAPPRDAKQSAGYTRAIPIERALRAMQAPGPPATVVAAHDS